MKTIFFILLLCINCLSYSQNNALVLNGAYLHLNGGTQTNPVQVVINQASTSGIARNSGHIISEEQYNYIKWLSNTNTGNYIFPFGFSTSDYIPFEINKTSTNNTPLSASTWATPADNTVWAGVSSVAAVTNVSGQGGVDAVNSVIDRWWDIKANPTTTADFVFRYRGAENTTTYAPSGIFAAQNWSGVIWNSPVGSGSGVTTGIGTVTVTNNSNFTPWILSSFSYYLPVELFSFDVSADTKNTYLNWKTASEANSKHFEIERSADAIRFEPIGNVAAHGNSSTIQQYTFTDFNPLEGKNYYRLRLVDNDGTYTYSEIKWVNFSKKILSGINIYPNPVSEILTVKNFQSENSISRIEIMDVAGHSVLTVENENQASVKMNIHSLSKGVYLIKIHSGTQAETFKFIKIDH